MVNKVTEEDARCDLCSALRWRADFNHTGGNTAAGKMKHLGLIVNLKLLSGS